MRDKNFNITIYAGEAFEVESIRQAIQSWGAHRIEHGLILKKWAFSQTSFGINVFPWKWVWVRALISMQLQALTTIHSLSSIETTSESRSAVTIVLWGQYESYERDGASSQVFQPLSQWPEKDIPEYDEIFIHPSWWEDQNHLWRDQKLICPHTRRTRLSLRSVAVQPLVSRLHSVNML